MTGAGFTPTVLLCGKQNTAFSVTIKTYRIAPSLDAPEYSFTKLSSREVQQWTSVSHCRARPVSAWTRFVVPTLLYNAIGYSGV